MSFKYYIFDYLEMEHKTREFGLPKKNNNEMFASRKTAVIVIIWLKRDDWKK